MQATTGQRQKLCKEAIPQNRCRFLVACPKFQDK